MADKMTKEQRSKCMSRIRGKDTGPEMIVRRWLWQRGYRYRKHEKRLPGTPDIVMRKYGIVIFIHGCFWHGHEGHLHLPQTNADFWRTKIERNKARDARQKEELLAMGWSVLTVWETIPARTHAGHDRIPHQRFLSPSERPTPCRPLLPRRPAWQTRRRPRHSRRRRTGGRIRQQRGR